MDAGHFDRLARTVSQGLTRRTLTSLLGGLALGSSLASHLDLAQAKKGGSKKKTCPPCKKKKAGKCKGIKPDGTPCENGGQCQSGRCLQSPPPPPPPPPDAAVVASSCLFGGDSAIRSNALGQPFIAQRGGRLDRAEVTADTGPGGQFAIEIRDLPQGQDIANAPVLASVTVTVPAISSGTKVVTAQFAMEATLTAGDQYALVVRSLGGGGSQQFFRIAPAANCPDPGLLLYIPPGQTTFTPAPVESELEHTVYVVP